MSAKSTANEALFAAYKSQLIKKENQAARARQPTTPGGSSSSVHSTPSKQRPQVTGLSSQPQTPQQNGGGSSMTTPIRTGFASPIATGNLPPPSFASPPAPQSQSQHPTTPPRTPSSTTATPGGSVRNTPASYPRKRVRLSQEEINKKWKEIFSTLEKWTADEPVATPTTPSQSSSSTSSRPRVPCSYASALTAQATYEVELVKYTRACEGHAILLQQHTQLVQQAMHQRTNGVAKGEKRIVVPSPPVAPIPPSQPPLTPYTPAVAEEDVKWREEMQKNQEAMRHDFPHRSIESYLLSYLHRPSHPLTQLKDSFVMNFLEAYGMRKYSTTNQASDMLLSNALPTLLYFLEKLTIILQRVFPELDSNRNAQALESIRQSSMEAIFPSIFPTLFGLYRRKYFFRDAELSSKMHILSSTGKNGCNITLEDLGVSKWLCLDEKLVQEDVEKRRKEREAKSKSRKGNGAFVNGTNGDTNGDHHIPSSTLDSPPAITRSKQHITSSSTSASSTSSHPISQLTHGSLHVNGDDDDIQKPYDPANESLESAFSSAVVSPSTSISRSNNQSSTPTQIYRSSHVTQSPVRIQHARSPTTRIASDFEPSSLAMSPRAERIQDLLSRSPGRRTMPMPGASPSGTSSMSKSMSRSRTMMHQFDTNGVSGTVTADSISTDTTANTTSNSTTTPPATKHRKTFSEEQRERDAALLRDASPSSVVRRKHGKTFSEEQIALAKAALDGLAPENDSATVIPAGTVETRRQVLGFATSATSTNGIDLSPSLVPVAAPASTSSLGLALKQLKNGTNGSDETTNNTSATSASSRANPDSSKSASSNSKPSLGFGQSMPVNSSLGDDDSDNDSPHMPTLDAPALGSSMPMLQGLPSSLLTHTPGTGSELLKRELLQQRKEEQARRKTSSVGVNGLSSPTASTNGNGHHSTNGTPHVSADITSPTANRHSKDIAALQHQQSHHLHPQQPFLHSTLLADPDADLDESLAGEEFDMNADIEVEPHFPYQEAVVLLRRLSNERTPRDKLQCLIAVSMELLWCVDRFYSRPHFTEQGFRPRPEDLCINADDLLSIVSFILIKSQLPNIISEAAFIDDFISRSMKLHMPGYFLATLQASIELCTKLDKEKFLTRQQLLDEERDAQGIAAGSTPATTPQNGNSNENSGGNGVQHREVKQPSTSSSSTSASSAVTVSSSSSKPAAVAPSHQRRGSFTLGGIAGSAPRVGVVGVIRQPPQQTSLTPSASSLSSSARTRENSGSSNGGGSNSNSGKNTPTSRVLTSIPPPNLPHVQVPPSTADTTQTHSTQTPSATTIRSASFHSAPHLRIESSTDLDFNGVMNQPFQLNLEHFSPQRK